MYQYLCNVTQERVTKPALCAFQYNEDLLGICFFNQVRYRCILFNTYLYLGTTLILSKWNLPFYLVKVNYFCEIDCKKDNICYFRNFCQFQMGQVITKGFGLMVIVMLLDN